MGDGPTPAEAMALAQSRWRELHLEAVAALRAYVASVSTPMDATEAAAALNLPLTPETASAISEAQSRINGQRGSALPKLLTLVHEHEQVLEDMYTIVRGARLQVCDLSPHQVTGGYLNQPVHQTSLLPTRLASSQLNPLLGMGFWQAADRGENGLCCSAADMCAILSAQLRAYEAELQLKQTVSSTLHSDLPADTLQTLLIAWESQSGLEGVDAMLAGADEQHRFEQNLNKSKTMAGTSGGAEIDLSSSEAAAVGTV